MAIQGVADATGSHQLTAQAQGLNATTLSVTTDDGSADAVRLIGIAEYATDTGACGANQALARMNALLGGQSLTIEPGLGGAYIWLPDGQNLAQALIREGDVPAASDAVHPLRSAFAAAQTAAIADQVGIWAPGACRDAPGGGAATTVDRGSLATFVTSSTFAVERARLAVQVLHDQARSAPLVGTGPAWQTTTTTALGWLHQSTQVLQAAVDSGGPGAPVHTELVTLGSELQTGADGYAVAAAAGDFNQMQLMAGQLSQSADALSPLLAELRAIGSAYGLGD